MGGNKMVVCPSATICTRTDCLHYGGEHVETGACAYPCTREGMHQVTCVPVIKKDTVKPIKILEEKAYPIILVEWRDSAFQPSVWEFIEDIEPLVDVHCTSVGFLLEETEEYITIALAISKTQVLGRTTIPKGCIISRKVLTP